MTRISGRRLDNLLEQRMYELLWEHLANLSSLNLIKEFLQNVLTYNEQVIIAKRLAIAVLLARGYTYEEIDQTLKVSKATVGTIHKQILIGAPGIIRAIRSIQKQEKLEEFWDKVEETLLKLSLPAAVGSVTHAQKSRSGKQIVISKRKREQL